ncbi:MAG: hypothetical protein IJU23_13110 [Proteobacteria bacterium]|nr:hypothetical protein [Pseudomonadota bacterium]
MQSNTNTTDINSSRQESNHNTESPVGNSFNPDLDIDLPDISAKISSASMGRLQQFYDKHKLYTKLVIILFVLALLGVLIAVSSSESDKYSRILLGVGLGLFFVAIILTINFSLLSGRNTKTATVTFKTIAVHQELCRYIENPEMMKNVYVYKDNASSISTNEDLSGSQKPEFVMRALGIVNPKCEESHITEWIHGIYHRKPFRFFEV